LELSEFKNRLEKYISETSTSTGEATKAYFFLEFIRDVFKDVTSDKPHKLYPKLEKSIKSEKTILIKGRADAIIGNLIIEFEKNLKERKIIESEEQLQRYTSILWNEIGVTEYVLLATDGIQFRVYFPRSDKESNFEVDDIRLELISEMKLTNTESDLAYNWLDRFILYRSKIVPTP